MGGDLIGSPLAARSGEMEKGPSPQRKATGPKLTREGVEPLAWTTRSNYLRRLNEW